MLRQSEPVGTAMRDTHGHVAPAPFRAWYPEPSITDGSLLTFPLAWLETSGRKSDVPCNQHHPIALSGDRPSEKTDLVSPDRARPGNANGSAGRCLRQSVRQDNRAKILGPSSSKICVSMRSTAQGRPRWGCPSGSLALRQGAPLVFGAGALPPLRDLPEFRRHRREVRFLRTRLGRVIRDIDRKVAGNAALESSFQRELALAHRRARSAAAPSRPEGLLVACPRGGMHRQRQAAQALRARLQGHGGHHQRPRLGRPVRDLHRRPARHPHDGRTLKDAIASVKAIAGLEPERIFVILVVNIGRALI
jgi:hypothetical protein